MLRLLQYEHVELEAMRLLWNFLFLTGTSLQGPRSMGMQSAFSCRLLNEVDGWEDGGPIYSAIKISTSVNYTITGVLSGWQYDGAANRLILFAGGQAMVGLAGWARANWPA
jgi:hypothetical protein